MTELHSSFIDRTRRLLGSAPVMPVHPEGSDAFIARGGRIPAPMQSLKN